MSELTAMLAARMGTDADDARPGIIMAAMLAASTAASIHWATHGDDEPRADAVARALSLVYDGLAGLDKPLPVWPTVRKR